MSELEYLRAIVGLSSQRSIETAIELALEAVLAHTGATYGYIEVLNERIEDAPPVWRARASSDKHLGWVRRVISRGIIGHARLEGRTLSTSRAAADPRFKNSSSVKMYEIGAVICAPFDGFWTSGVVYLQGSPGGVEFDAVACAAAETAATQLGVLVERLRRDLWPQTPLQVELDAVKRHFVEQALVRNDWNYSAVQRETGLSRKHLREFVRSVRRDR